MKFVTETSLEEDNRAVVRLRFKTKAQLLDPDDPSPLPQKEITQEAEDSILNNVFAWKLKRPVGLELQVPGIREPAEAEGIAEAVRNHLRFVLKDHERDMRIFIRERRAALAMTVFNLVVATIFIVILNEYPAIITTIPGIVIGTVIVIMNWATIWDTYEFFIFDGRQNVHRKKLLEKIINGDITVMAVAESGDALPK